MTPIPRANDPRRLVGGVIRFPLAGEARRPAGGGGVTRLALVGGGGVIRFPLVGDPRRPACGGGMIRFPLVGDGRGWSEVAA